MRDERERPNLARVAGEPTVLKRSNRLLVNPGDTVGIEVANPGSVGVVMALDDEAVRRVK